MCARTQAEMNGLAALMGKHYMVDVQFIASGNPLWNLIHGCFQRRSHFLPVSSSELRRQVSNAIRDVCEQDALSDDTHVDNLLVSRETHTR